MEIEIKTMERRLLKELHLLAAKRVVKPSVQASARMNAIFKELFDLTGDDKYKL
jgi:hypothetical protein